MTTSTLRGKVIKTPDATPGLLYVNGQQQPFQLERIWQCSVTPAPDMTVDVEFDEGNAIQAIRAVPDSQLAKEQAALALGSAKVKGRVLVSSLTARVGKPALIATGLLVVGGYFLDFLSFPAPHRGVLHFSCWEFLGWLHYLQDLTVAPSSSPLRILLQVGARHDLNPGAGTIGLLAIAALAGPLLPAVWKDRRAVLGGLLPIAFTLYVGSRLWRFIDASVTPDMLGYLDARTRVAGQERLLSAVGLGGYIAALAALFLSVRAVAKYLARRGSETV